MTEIATKESVDLSIPRSAFREASFKGRLEILMQLEYSGPRSVSAIVGGSGVGREDAYVYLEKLRAAGMVESKHKGSESYSWLTARGRDVVRAVRLLQPKGESR